MSGNNTHDPVLTLMFVGVFVYIVLYILWSIFGVQILEALRYVRMAELFLISPFSSHAMPCVHWLQSADVSSNVGINTSVMFTLPSSETYRYTTACFGAGFLGHLPAAVARNYYYISPVSLSAIADIIGPVMRWPVVFAGAGMGIYAYFFTVKRKFRTTHNLESFIKIQAMMWPVIKPILHFSPAKLSARVLGDVVPDKIPMMAEALSPEEWLTWHRISLANGIPDREAARRAFLLQLGPRWSGAKKLPAHMMALFACFALMGGQKRDEAEDLLSKIAECWSVERGLVLPPPLLDEIKKVLGDPETGGRAEEIAKGHAYRTTALLGVLKWARFMGGVLAPAQFLWLRAADRTLWYPMNNLGRRSFHVEGAGALAHFMSEQSAKRALIVPRVDTAIVTLNQYMGRGPIKMPSREEPNVIMAKK